MTTPLHGFPDWQDPLHSSELLVQNDSVLVTATNQVPLSLLDMRNYQSFGVWAFATVSGAITADNTSVISMNWFTDSSETLSTWTDGMATHTQNATASAFDCPNLHMMMQDNVRGPFLRLSYTNLGPQSATMSLVVYGNSRSLAGRSMRQAHNLGSNLTAAGSMLLSDSANVGAGVTRRNHIALAPGLCSVVVNSGAAAVTQGASITAAGAGVVWQATNFLAVRDLIILPDESCIFRFINNTAGVINYNASIVANRGAF